MRTMTAIGLAVVLSLIGGVVLGTVGTLALLLVDWAVASRRPEDALNPGGGGLRGALSAPTGLATDTRHVPKEQPSCR
jgi:hypothetical protein